jgi:hypothetical protein
LGSNDPFPRTRNRRQEVAVSARRRAFAFALENSVSTEVVDRRKLRAICFVENPAAFKVLALVEN